MVLSVAGKYALITGGGSGINLEFARILLDQGCSVLLADLQLRPEAEALLSQYPSPKALFHKTDVSSWPQLSALWAKATSTFPSVDIVVPGAGLFEPEWSSFWEPPPSETNQGETKSRDGSAEGGLGHYATIDVNLTAPIRLSQLAIGYWTQKKMKGSLLHVGSVAGYTASVNAPIYFATKHAIHGFVRSLGGLYEALGIRSLCVAPGTINTPMWKEDPTKASMITEGFEWIEPEEVAAAMYELATNEEYGAGTILECSKGATRVIPQWGLTPPTGAGLVMPGFVAAREKVYDRLKTTGLKT